MTLPPFPSHHSADGSRYLHAVHNPTSTYPSFLLPLFSHPAGSNQLYIQLLSTNGTTVADFEAINEDLPSTAVATSTWVKIGDPILYAFQTANKTVLLGARSKLVPELVQLIGQAELQSRPLLLVEVIDFCQQLALLPAAIHDAYSHLEKLSPFSAQYWRDRGFLTPRARRAILGILGAHGALASGLAREWWYSISASLRDDEVVLRMDAEIAKKLESLLPAGWRDEVRDQLSNYLFAISKNPTQLRFEIDDGFATTVEPELIEGNQRLYEQIREIETSEAASLSMTNVLRSAPARPITEKVAWVTVTFGRRAIAAGRAVHRGSATAFDLRTFRGTELQPQLSPEEIAEILRSGLHEVAEATGRTHRILIVFDATSDAAHESQQFAESLPAGVSVSGVVIHATRDGFSEGLSGVWQSMIRTTLQNIVVISDNSIPTSESSKNTSIGTILQSLISVLDEWPLDDSLVGGLSTFSIGWTRHGRRDFSTALSRAIAGGVNPLLPFYQARSALVRLSSVGRPSEQSKASLAEQFNSSIQSMHAQRIPVDFAWQSRSFVSGGVVYGSASILARDIVPSRMSLDESLAWAARTVLSQFDFDIGPFPDRDHLDPSFVVSTPTGDRIRVSVPRHLELATAPEHLDAEVTLVESRSAQKRLLQEGNGRGRNLPLLYSDFFYFKNTTDLRWAASVIAYSASPIGKWPELFHDLVEEGIRIELTTRPERYELNVSLSELSKGTQISDISIEIEKCERLSGRGARFSGGLSLDVNLIYGSGADAEAIKDSYKGSFVAEVFPDGLSIIRAEADTASFFEPTSDQSDEGS